MEKAFCKYDHGRKGHLTKLEFKCAFIYLTGYKPGTQDMQTVKQFLGNQAEFRVSLDSFAQIMQVYLDQLRPQQDPVAESWELLGGKDRGFVTIRDFHAAFDRVMPRLVDRNVALEAFQELDADKDGKMTLKDFKDALLFEL